MKVKTNLFGKGQRIISDKYRDGWDRIWGKKDNDCDCGGNCKGGSGCKCGGKGSKR